MDGQLSFEDRIQPFLDRGWDLQPEPYRIMNVDGSPGLWKSRVLVLHHHPSETEMHFIWGSRKYAEKGHAEWGTILIGLRWLEETVA